MNKSYRTPRIMMGDNVSRLLLRYQDEDGEEIQGVPTGEGSRSAGGRRSSRNNWTSVRFSTPRRPWLSGGVTETVIGTISMWYLILMVVLSILFNYSWSTYTKLTLLSLEGFYTYLYVTSILVLLVLLVEQQHLRDWRALINKSVPCILTSGMSCVLGMASIVFCSMEIIVICKAFWGSLHNGLILSLVNPILLVVLIILEILFVILVQNIWINRTWGIFWRCFYKLSMVHIVATNICLWFKLTFQETVAYLLHHHMTSHHTSHTMDHSVGTYFWQTNISTYENHALATTLIPPYDNSMTAFQCFTNQSNNCDPNDMNMWSLEESLFTCSLVESNVKTRAVICPFIIENCLLMGLVFYEASLKVFQANEGHFDRLSSLSTVVVSEDGPNRGGPGAAQGDDSNLSLVMEPRYSQNKKGAILGAIPGLLVVGIALVLIISKGTEHIIIPFNTTITNICNIAMIFALIIKLPQESMNMIGQSLDLEEEDECLDENLLFVTLTGILLFNVSDIMAYFFTSHSCLEAIPNLIDNVSSMLQHLLQVIMICLCRRTKKMKNKAKFVIAFVMMYNMMEWLLITFMLTSSPLNEQYFCTNIKFYGFFGWEFIWRITLPLMAFFRFHSFGLILGLIISK